MGTVARGERTMLGGLSFILNDSTHLRWQRGSAIEMAIRVECCAGYCGEEEPRAFWLGECRLAVRSIVDRWFAPTQRWVKVEAEDGHMYVLRHDEATGDWELAAYTRGAG